MARVKKILVLGVLSFSLFCVATERPMVVVIPSYNNIQWYERNLNSILDQQYSNFRIVYIDDLSTDGTAQAVRALINKRQAQHRVKLLCNDERRGALANIYRAVHSCKDDEIVVAFDGDDWAKDAHVLSRINAAYEHPNTWMTYGQYEEYPRGKLGLCKEIPQPIVQMNAYREYDWCSSHLRTFYAGLFKKIKLEDLIDNGEFFDVTWDRAFMLPMLEMAGGRHRFIRDVLYVYNQATPLNDFKKKLLRQLYYEKLIHSKPKYQKIETYEGRRVEGCADVVVCSDNHPAHLLMLLETVSRYCSGVGSVHVIYTAHDEACEKAYASVKEIFPTVHWSSYAKPEQFHPTVISCVEQLPHEYLFLVHDRMVIKDFVAFEQCVRLLEQTGAIGFYLALGKNITATAGLNRLQQIPPAVCIEEGVFAWQFKDGEFDWRMPFSLNAVVYPKDRLKQFLQTCAFGSIAEFEYLWNKMHYNTQQQGLFSDESKAMGLAQVNPVEELGILNGGLKIDTVPLFRTANYQCYIAVPLEVIDR